MPLTLHSDGRGTLPRGRLQSPLLHRLPGWIPSGDDRATRLADVILSWNVAKHFYPYWDDVGNDWAQELPIALQRAAVAADRFEFTKTLRRMIAQMHDGHSAVYHWYGDPRPLPIEWEILDGRLVITAVDTTSASIRPGTEVLTLNGQPAGRWIDEALMLEGAATLGSLRIKAASAIPALLKTDTVAMGLRSPMGEVYDAQLRKTWYVDANVLLRPERIAELRPGVLYVDLARVGAAELDTLMPRLQACRGIVFDSRAPAGAAFWVVRHLSDSTLHGDRPRAPIVQRPDWEGVRYQEWSEEAPAAAPRLRARVAILIDGRSISSQESVLSFIEGEQVADLVGEPTAGTNGNVVKMELPGGYAVWFTGMQVLKRDGTRHHGIGIQPTVLVARRAADVIAGRDLQLERALEIVSR